MLFRVDASATTPLGGQIAAQIRGAISAGELCSGDRLPPARELASDLQVNVHTVLGAYGRLRDAGLIDLRRGRGARVKDAATPARADLQGDIEELVEKADRIGISREELSAMIGESGTG